MELSTSIEEDIREALFYKLADAKCPILELNHKVPTLEEVFLRLTGDGTKQYGGKMSKEEKKKMRQKLAKREETVEKEVAEKEVEKHRRACRADGRKGGKITCLQFIKRS